MRKKWHMTDKHKPYRENKLTVGRKRKCVFRATGYIR